MNYFLILIYMFLPFSVDAQTRGEQENTVATVTILSGSPINVYSGGEKKPINDKNVPYVIYSGDEVQTTNVSHCELLLNSGSTIYIGPETLVSVNKKAKQYESIFLKYGFMMFKGEKPVDLRAGDIYVNTISGDFLARYAKTNFELTLLNFGSELYVKQSSDQIPLRLPKNRYIKAISFKDEKTWGDITISSIPKLYEKFKVQFKPEGSSSYDSFSPKTSSETKKDTDLKSGNVDKIKRTTGL